MVKIENLERLSCLKLDDTLKENVENSIIGVVNTIDIIHEYTLPHTHFEDLSMYSNLDITKLEFLTSTEDKVNGVHLEDGLFLAPKVIKK